MATRYILDLLTGEVTTEDLPKKTDNPKKRKEPAFVSRKIYCHRY